MQYETDLKMLQHDMLERSYNYSVTHLTVQNGTTTFVHIAVSMLKRYVQP